MTGTPDADAASDATGPDDWAPVQIDTTVAHPARMYDFYLGGYSLYK